MATKRSMKGWDTRVKEAQREPLEVTLPDPDAEDGGTFTAHVLPFTSKRVEELQESQRTGVMEDQVRVIFGHDADRVGRVFADAPFAAVQDLLEDILVDMGVISGNR